MPFSRVKLAIYGYLREYGAAGKPEIKEQFDIADRTFYRHIEFFKSRGLVYHNDHQYHLTDKGKKLTFAGLCSYTQYSDLFDDATHTKEPEPEALQESDTQAVEVIDEQDTNPNPDPSELTEREKYVAGQLQTGASINELQMILTRVNQSYKHISKIYKTGAGKSIRMNQQMSLSYSVIR
jgi:hypothetical protein